MKQKGVCPHDRQKIVVVKGVRVQLCCQCGKKIGKELKNA